VTPAPAAPASVPARAAAAPAAGGPPAPAPARPATTTYGRAVEKARANVAKHEKTLVKPTDEAVEGK
jgi:hypothetical protein